jgi:hypothetical protein
MAGQDTTALANLLRPNVQGSAIDLLYRETDCLNLLRARGCVRDGVGGSPYKWNALSSANGSAETFSEGQAPGVPGRQTIIQASVAAFMARVMIGETGHARDNRMKGAFYEDPFAMEVQKGTADLLKLVEDELCGSTADRGIAGIVDSTGTYAGLSQGTYSIWASEENGSINTLGLDDMQDLYEELTSASVGGVARGASPTDWLMPINQITNYTNTIGAGASAGGTFRLAPGMPIDFGQTAPGTQSFNGIPIRMVRGITSTEIYLVDLMGWELLIQRDLQTDPVPGNPEMSSWQLSAGFAVKVGARNKHGKMTGVSA